MIYKKKQELCRSFLIFHSKLIRVENIYIFFKLKIVNNYIISIVPRSFSLSVSENKISLQIYIF